MHALKSLLGTLLISGALLGAQASSAPVTRGIHNVVLVHGALVDGSGWRAVYDILTRDGYHVSVVQEPLTGFANDVEATRRVIRQQRGPLILVGHSYGGMVVTEAGSDPAVRALVYVSAFQPQRGESLGALSALFPLPDAPKVQLSGDAIFLWPQNFRRSVANDLPAGEATFLADSQVYTAAASFAAKVTVTPWRQKPSYAVLSANDRTISPALQRFMYRRSGAQVMQVPSGHLAYISHPAAVAAVIERAARAAR